MISSSFGAILLLGSRYYTDVERRTVIPVPLLESLLR